MRVHINVLYGLIVVLLMLNIVSFVSMSSHASRIVSDQERLRDDLDDYIAEVRQENQGNVNEIVRIIARQNEAIALQRTDFTTEIQELRVSQDSGFSEVIAPAIQSTVSIRTDRSTGTGFFVTPDGYIITNNHVINGADFVLVELYDDTTLEAEIIGVDTVTDVALLKVPGTFTYFELANSDSVSIGSAVIAVGNPLGLAFTVTEGIVSATNRQGPNGLYSYIQTDVTLNPGNSGGPLINREGAVIGINNFKIGGAESLGFALESNVAREIANSLADQELVP